MKILEALTLVQKHGNQYAKVYANEAIRSWSEMRDDEKYAQLLYVISNIPAMRKPNKMVARQIRSVIREAMVNLR